MRPNVSYRAVDVVESVSHVSYCSVGVHDELESSRRLVRVQLVLTCLKTHESVLSEWNNCKMFINDAIINYFTIKKTRIRF